jgi:hypothetical protein
MSGHQVFMKYRTKYSLLKEVAVNYTYIVAGNVRRKRKVSERVYCGIKADQTCITKQDSKHKYVVKDIHGKDGVTDGVSLTKRSLL